MPPIPNLAGGVGEPGIDLAAAQLEDEFPEAELPRTQPGPVPTFDPVAQGGLRQQSEQPADRLPVPGREDATNDEVGVSAPAQAPEVVVPE